MEWLIEKVKVFMFAVLPVALASYFGALAIPFGLLMVCNVIDYATGVIAAPKRGQQRSSERGFAGIVKKICMWLLVLVGVVVDMLLAFVSGAFGWALPVSFAAACLVCVWLLLNELISIIENLADIGVSVPFLLPLVKWVKKKAEDTMPKAEAPAAGEREQEEEG